jgi:hypothetical protein
MAPSTTQAPAFDASRYPRDYAPSLVNRLIWISFGGLLTAIGILGVWYSLVAGDELGPKGPPLMITLSLLFVLLGGYLILYMALSKIILRPDAVEVQNPLSKRTMLREEIGWRRFLPNTSTIELLPRDKSQKKLKIAFFSKPDALFTAWFASIPDIDAAELAKSDSEIASDVEFELTPEQRSEQLARARTTAKWLTRGALLISAWGVFYPRPYQLIMGILAAVPLLAVMLMLRSRGVYEMEGRRNDARPSLVIPFLIPSCVLAIRAITGVNFLRWLPLFTLSLAGACALTLLVASADRRMRERRADVGAIFLTTFYALGVAAQADELLDRSTPQVFRVAVLSKRVSSGKSTTYYLRVEPWGPKQDANDVSVPGRLYGVVLPKQTVCINLLQGALKIPWYFATACT